MRNMKASPPCFRARAPTEGVAPFSCRGEMRAIELDALLGGIGCGLGGAKIGFEKRHLSLSDF